MPNSKSKQSLIFEKFTKKFINVSLDKDKVKEFGFKNNQTALKEIKTYLSKKGFKYVKGSGIGFGFESKAVMDERVAFIIFIEMFRDLKWLYFCAKHYAVGYIPESIDLLPVLRLKDMNNADLLMRFQKDLKRCINELDLRASTLKSVQKDYDELKKLGVELGTELEGLFEEFLKLKLSLNQGNENIYKKVPKYGTKIIMNEEKMLKKGIEPSEFYANLDKIAKEHGMIKEGVTYICKPSKQYMGALGEFVLYALPRLKHFTSYVKEWLWLSPKQGTSDMIEFHKYNKLKFEELN